MAVSYSKTWPERNPTETYDFYYRVGICTPPSPTYLPLSLGEALRGQRLVASPYTFTIPQEEQFAAAAAAEAAAAADIYKRPPSEETKETTPYNSSSSSSSSREDKVHMETPEETQQRLQRERRRQQQEKEEAAAIKQGPFELCRMQVSEETLEDWRVLIDNEYLVELYADGIPVVFPLGLRSFESVEPPLQQQQQQQKRQQQEQQQQEQQHDLHAEEIYREEDDGLLGFNSFLPRLRVSHRLATNIHFVFAANDGVLVAAAAAPGPSPDGSIPPYTDITDPIVRSKP